MQGSGGSPLKALGEASFPLGAEAGSPTPKPIIVRALGLSITALAFNAWASRTEHFSKCRQRLDDGALQPVTNRGGNEDLLQSPFVTALRELDCALPSCTRNSPASFSRPHMARMESCSQPCHADANMLGEGSPESGGSSEELPDLDEFADLDDELCDLELEDAEEGPTTEVEAPANGRSVYLVGGAARTANALKKLEAAPRPPKPPPPPLYPQIPQFSAGADGAWKEAPKTRLPAEALAMLRVEVKDGLLMSSDGLVPLDSGCVPAGECRDNLAIYVMLASGALYATFSSNTVHHPALADGLPVAACGSLLVRHGRLLMLDNCSGHYRPPAACLEVVISGMRSMGVSMSGAEVRAVSADGRESETVWPAGSLPQSL